MKSDEVKSLFVLAGFEVAAMKPLVDGYMGYHPDDPRFPTTLPRCAWWFVKTQFGWIEFGARKRVFSIDWTDTGLRSTTITKDDVTRDEHLVHAWSTPKALEYLTALRQALTDYAKARTLVLKPLLQVAEAAIEYIDAIPKITAMSFPAMPGFDRDWADEVMAEARAGK